MDPHLYSQLNFFQQCQDNSVGEKIVFSTNDLEKLDIHMKNNVNPHFTVIRKNYSKWITNLHAEVETTELLKQKIKHKKTFGTVGIGKDFLGHKTHYP